MYVDSKSELERAKGYFYSCRWPEAYAILRRYFDRLPFKAELEHARYIALFTRLLLELGKDFELKFYLTTLENLYRTQKTAELGYQLAIVYGDSGLKNESRQILEEIIRGETSEFVRVRAMMRLAHCYDVAGEIEKYKATIRAIPPTEDTEFQRLLKIWYAKIAADELNFREADKILNEILSEVTMESNWYVYCSARIMVGYLALKENNLSKAKETAEAIREDIKKFSFRSVSRQLAALDTDIELAERGGTVSYIRREEGFEVAYGANKQFFEQRSFAERLLESFLKDQRLSKSEIVRTLYRRSYRGAEDDKLIYYHIHSLRKILKDLGLPDHVLEVQDQGYVFQPEVQQLAEDS